MQRRCLGVCFVTAVLACGGPPPSRPSPAPKATSHAPAPPPRAAEPALTALRTGALLPESASVPLELEPVARVVGPEFETLRFRFERPRRTRLDSTDVVDVPDATLAFISEGFGDDGSLWVRRPRARAGTPVSGTVYASADSAPGVRFDVRTKSGATPAPITPDLEADWLRALAAGRRDDYRSVDAFSVFMSRRLRNLAEKKKPAPRRGPVPVRTEIVESTSELTRLMETTTGRHQIQLAIQHNNTLALELGREPRKLPLSAAPAPELPRADYTAMLSALGRTPPVEPLAAVAPADFWFLRSRSFGAFLDLLELTESFGQPAADLLSGRSEERGTTARYTSELALERSELARLLGPSVIESVAVVGSDPYVHDGTDVTFVFRVSAPALFDAALVKALAVHEASHGRVVTSELTHEGVTIRVERSSNGRIRRHRAAVAGVELVSNSPNAIRRVISAALGRAPRLADEADFRYLLARDAGTPDETLAFLSDRFVLNAIGPAQKIAQARRQLALAELTTPGYAALLFGWLNGRSPKDGAELVKHGVLLSSELAHADGAPIAWQPGKPAASRWGTPSALEPLIDAPPVQKISAAEQRAYADFSSRYTFLWSEYVDPVMARFARSKDTGRKLDVSVRALPLLRSENRELVEMVGDARIEVPPLDSGLRWVLAIGKEAELRRELDRSARFAGHSLSFNWLGDSVVLGLADRPELTQAARPFVSRKLEPPAAGERFDELEAFADLPLYASVEVRQRAGAVIALGILRKLAEDVARDMIRWRDGGKYRDIPVTDIELLPSGLLREGGHVYYALCPRALVFSLHRGVLERLIDDELEGKAPRGAGDGRRHDLGQFVIELGPKKEGALVRTIGWLAAAELVARNDSRHTAEAILRGAPESRASGDAFTTYARAILGHVPLTPDGNLYEYSVEGIRDPVRGTPYAPVFPPTPVAGSPLAAVLDRFARLRSSISFDVEPGSRENGPPNRSFSANLSLELR